MADPSVSTIERRFTTVRVELRMQDERKQIAGYAIKWNRPSQNLGGFVERVDPAFANKSRGDGFPGVMARYNHDNNMLLGTTAGGTLVLRVDAVGLEYEINPPSGRQDVVELVERGDVGSSSFAWNTRTTEDDWGVTDTGFPLRTLLSGQLVDVAPCNSGLAAYPDATAGLRSLAEKMHADLEEVRTLAAQNELRKFFVRTDGPGAPPKKLTHVDARAMIARHLVG
jgi:HK97 family phage prohead protease